MPSHYIPQSCPLTLKILPIILERFLEGISHSATGLGGVNNAEERLHHRRYFDRDADGYSYVEYTKELVSSLQILRIVTSKDRTMALRAILSSPPPPLMLPISSSALPLSALPASPSPCLTATDEASSPHAPPDIVAKTTRPCRLLQAHDARPRPRLHPQPKCSHRSCRRAGPTRPPIPSWPHRPGAPPVCPYRNTPGHMKQQ